ncbi:hypothetical protein [Pontibacter pudoricolor]|uniref:hypothetical protein n=1 Tax=Pontibacter pudoricolor TaxID=2694930 RepID=UPI0013916A2C|nr:hypothetical protein [Pontibacter pudoricolor]
MPPLDSLILFEDIANVPDGVPIVGVQRSNNINPDNDNLVIALAHPSQRATETVSTGLFLNDNLRRKVKFLQAPAILQKQQWQQPIKEVLQQLQQPKT